MTRRGFRPGEASISVQLIALLIAGLVVAQGISFVTMMSTPPPRPQVFRISEAAAALHGGPLATRFGRPLERTISADLPADLSVVGAEHDRLSNLLAAELSAAPSDVRLIESPPPPEWRLIRWLRPHRAPPWGPGPGPAGPGGPGGPGGPHGPPGHARFGAEAIVGAFSAAALQPDGRWLVVRSPPEPFPNEWQVRILLCLLAGLLIVAPAGFLFARRITAPLQHFTDAAEALGRDPHRPLLALSGPAEIGAAARAFNEMQVRLRRYIDDRTGMVGAISHDLRTPLARMRFKLEGAPPALQESLTRDVAQMEEMIEAVLAFIREEGAPRTREPFDLLSLLECVVDDAAMVGADAQLVDGEPMVVQGDPIGLQRLFGNLVDNAIKYGGEARVSLKRAGQQAVVEIADPGRSLSREELGRVFQPFYRTDTSRNLDKAGVGLGLPIARSTARAHGGEVELACDENGTRAVVTLPLANAAGASPNERTTTPPAPALRAIARDASDAPISPRSSPAR